MLLLVVPVDLCEGVDLGEYLRRSCRFENEIGHLLYGVLTYRGRRGFPVAICVNIDVASSLKYFRPIPLGLQD